MLNVPGVRSLPFNSRSTIGATSAKHDEHMRANKCQVPALQVCATALIGKCILLGRRGARQGRALKSYS